MAQLNYFLVIGPAGIDRLGLGFQVANSLFTQGWNVGIFQGVNDVNPAYVWIDEDFTRNANVMLLTAAAAANNRDRLSRIWNEYKVAV